jgi:hypothetical protein
VFFIVSPRWKKGKWKKEQAGYPTCHSLLGNSLSGTSPNASSAINASIRIAFCLAVFHRKRDYGANSNAGFATDAGIFVNFNCHNSDSLSVSYIFDEIKVYLVK